MSRIKVLTLVGALLAATAPALGTPPGHAVPLAEEQVGGTVLTVIPRIGYEIAVLRVSGPDGYALTEHFKGGVPLAVDLAVETERASPTGREPQNAPSQREGSSLPDGRYNYEVVFIDATGESQVHSGLFFVEGASLVSRDAKRAELAGVREDLGRLRRESQASSPGTEVAGPVSSPETFSTPDWIAVTDGPNDGITYLSLDSDSPGANLYWLTANVMGDLEFHEDLNYTFPGTPRVTFERGGQVGIGTTAPQRALHVVDTSAFVQLRLDDGFGDFFDLNVGPVGLWFLDNDSQSVLRVNHSASTSALVVDGAGIGVGTSGPEASLHVQPVTNDGNVLVRAATGGPYSLFAIENNNGAFFRITNGSGVGSNGSWTFSSTSADNFVISSQGNAGSEFSMQPDGDLTISGSLSQMSSRASKENLAPVDGRAVLEKVAALPVLEWNYIKDGSQVRHVGAMAEDFHAAFGLNDSRRTISVLDASGVALAAIQGLHAEVAALREALDSRDAEIDRLREQQAEIDQLREQQAELAKRLVALAGGGS